MMTRTLLLGIATAVSLTLPGASAFGQENDTGARSATPYSGPEFVPDAPYRATFWQDGDPGQQLVLSGRVLDGAGNPLSGAVLDVWQADGAGYYHEDAYRGKIRTDASGKYLVRTAVPGNNFGARHIHMFATHDDHGSVRARVVFKGDPNLSDYDRGSAIVLEQTRVDDQVVYIGTFDVVIPGQ